MWEQACSALLLLLLLIFFFLEVVLGTATVSCTIPVSHQPQRSPRGLAMGGSVSLGNRSDHAGFVVVG